MTAAALPEPAAARAAAWRGVLRADDLRGLARLGIDGVVGVTGIVESMHHAVRSLPTPLGRAPAGRPAGITGLVYGAVRGTTQWVGRGLDALLAGVPAATSSSTRQREAFIAALNGVWGDHLAASGNPLAITMSLRIGGQPWRTALQAPTDRLLVLVHGLAMNDLQWTCHGHDHGQALARACGVTPLYLHYNSGRHVADNGRDFAAQLEALVAQWPLPVRELVIVGHSMGGLVARSACAVAAGQHWTTLLSAMVFLGTPHHGAPLERGGRLVDALLDASPYAAPLARLGRMRSAGITDLRYGNVIAAHAATPDRHAQRRDERAPLPLPAGVRCHVVAATRAKRLGGVGERLIGDGLVPVASALGDHRRRALSLQVPPERRLVVTSADHWDLLSRDDVCAQLRAWLA